MPIESKQWPDWQFRCHRPAGLSEFDTYIIICKNDFAPHLFDIHLKYRSICRWWILFFFPHLWRIHTTNGSSVCWQFSRAADGLCAHIDSLTMPRICLCSRHEWWLCRHHHRQRRTRIVPHNRKKKRLEFVRLFDDGFLAFRIQFNVCMCGVCVRACRDSWANDAPTHIHHTHGRHPKKKIKLHYLRMYDRKCHSKPTLTMWRRERTMR